MIAEMVTQYLKGFPIKSSTENHTSPKRFALILDAPFMNVLQYLTLISL